MTLFTLRSVHKDFGIKEILRDASFSLDEGDKVGLIGTNGSGKSTLLKMIAGLEPFDSGDFWVNPGAKVVYLPQQPDFDASHTVLEQVFADAGESMALIREYEDLSHHLAQGTGDTDRLMAQISVVTEKITAADGWDLETSAKAILSKLGIEDFDAKVGDLSGGYRKRVAIAAALLSDPDALLMDEPTNHLDAESVEWLQSYLSGFRGALLLITHDRYFLDQVTNRILEIDRGDLYSYAGNYAYYLEKKALSEASEVSSQKKHAGVLRRELEWLKRGPKARSTKQKARIDRIGDMQNREFKQALGKVDISTAGRRIGKKVIELENVAKGYEGGTLFKDFTYAFAPDDRIGIIGPNGVGKSTLMNVITGRLDPDSGTVEMGTTIHVGYFDQHSEDLFKNPEQRVIEYLKETAELVTTADGSTITASQMLERFLFTPNQQYAPLDKLSGGERRRLFLLQVLMSAPNLLILDEPTNDLDVQTLGVLEEYLEEFNGCVIVVSHDRYFLDRTVNTIFSFEGHGILRQYPGNYSLYLDYKKAEQEREAEQQRNATKSVSLPTKAVTATQEKATHEPKGKKLSYKEKREYEQLETQIPELEAEKEAIEKRLYGDAPSDYEAVTRLSEQLAALSAKIDAATERWMDLAERLE
ncbi:ABC-F family ATP-binding cassette domain-containing protein [Phormidium sp. FACHB-1136]|uniref:ABC-F family ATP-binding cassette domain-containing protein n=1 Tax=Phormidium sp. FACHB-1136 TaxID=2692848 RepID=UPI00168650F6|nr:ABC-F family ATP-binding cassette domain-containing protein [Phormidium sp. FACHB-1136]MBD2426386.1 ABC-F family ATP-binding cassette domain-containing protein [Phormidium sp. FACHB-1136]